MLSLLIIYVEFSYWYKWYLNKWKIYWIFQKTLTSFIYRSIAVYGCFAAGLASLIIFAAISWFNGKIDTSNGEETNRIALSRSIRITVYLITALLAIASSVISLIEVDQTARHIVPVRILKIICYLIVKKIKL